MNAQCWESVSCGDQFVGAVENGGALFMWGRNTSGQLGNGTFINQFTSNTQVAGNDWRAVSTSKFVDNNLQTGGAHTLAIKTNGTLWAWGSNSEGQLGNGSTENSNVPVQIGTDTDWEMVAAGSLHSIALKSDGTLWAWGNNAYGQLGNGTFISANTPIQMGVEANWEKISTYESHNLAIKSNGTLWAWGKNNFYQLGQNNNNQNQNAPIQVGSGTNWIFPQAGYQYSFSMKEDSTLWGWGNNSTGQLGNGSIGSFNPNPIQIGASAKWINVSAGGEHTVAIRADSTLWGWGMNFFGQLGQGNNTFQITSPVQITTDSNFGFIDVGHYYTMTMTSDTTLWGCGQNFSNVLATDDNNDRNVLTPIGCPSSIDVYTTINATSCDTYLSPSGNYTWTETGVYLDTIPGVGGNDSLFTVNLTINTVNVSVTQDGPILTANETEATYQWLTCPELTPIEGATDISYTAIENGAYAVIVSHDACSDTSDCFIVVSVGVSESAFENEITLFPNPSDGDFSIDLRDHYTDVTMSIFDLNGKIIQSGVYNGGQLLDLKLDEAPGVYLLSMQAGAKVSTIRLVIR